MVGYEELKNSLFEVLTMSRENLFLGNPGSEHGNIGSEDFNIEASLELRTLLIRNKLTTARLVQRLSEMGVDVTLRSLRERLRRGTFTHAFYLQCKRAVEAKREASDGQPKGELEPHANTLS